MEPFLCECVQDGCSAPVELSAAQYEAVRADEQRFFVYPGHEMPELDVVVERHEGFFVVERAGQDRPSAG
jgi:hypothetical protein